ncbi:MAG TPA: Uma2 family endonuclease [Gemmatimonadaceae bacterium]
MDPKDRNAPPPPAPSFNHAQPGQPGGLPEPLRDNLRVREPGGFRQGEVVFRLALVVGAFVHANRLGTVVVATGFKLADNPEMVRAPAIAFVRHDRVPRPSPWGHAELAPDLVVEVTAPDDRLAPVLAKVADWLTAGTRLVWVIDADRQAVHVYRADGSAAALGPADVLSGEDVLPGFAVPVSEIV